MSSPHPPSAVLSVREVRRLLRELLTRESARRRPRDVVVFAVDLAAFDCTWQDELLRGAERVPGYSFYPVRSGRYQPRLPAEICADVRAAISATRSAGAGANPSLVWCFIEKDRHVHEHGYDDHVASVLAGLDDLARELAQDGAVVAGHSDHGLVPAKPDPGLVRAIDSVRDRFWFEMGGAGRTRWLYTSPEAVHRVIAELRELLPDAVRVARADQIFPDAIRARVGSVVLVAEGDTFLTEPGYCYDHGSATDAELYVPFSVWEA